MIRGIRYKVILALIVGLLLESVIFSQEILREQQKLKEIKGELIKERETLKKAREKEQKTLNNLFIINRELAKAQKDLREAKSGISEDEKRIRQLKIVLQETEKNLEIKSRELRRRIVEAYKSGRMNYLEPLFSSSSISDFLTRTHYFERLILSDINLINEVREDYKKAKETKAELEGRIEEIKHLASVIEAKRNIISFQATEKYKAYELLRERRKSYERRVAELERSSKELEYLIKRIFSERAARNIAPPQSTGVLSWPAFGRIVSRFGYRRHPLWGGVHYHTGIDIGTPYGEAVRSADSGDVIFSGWWDGYGKAVVIDHGRGRSTVYGHLSRIYVESGDKVGKGQVVGLVGNTGFSTGPHLHFEVRQFGVPIDPTGLL